MSAAAPTLPSERTGYPALAELALRRQQLAAAAAGGVWNTEPAPQAITLGGRRALRFNAPGAPRGVLVHMHGGAFRVGAPEAVAPFAAALAKRCNVTVICPTYRLAPEQPFPAALVDGMAVFEALDAANDLPVVLSGDSAGGGLAAGMAILAAEGHRRLAGLILLSAWLDLTVSAVSYESNASSDPMFSRAAAAEAAALYLQGSAADDPLVSPVYGDVRGFPRTFINVGSGEVLLDDSRRMLERLRAAGVDARLGVIAGMEHVAVTRGLALPGAPQTFAAVAAFIDEMLARAP